VIEPQHIQFECDLHRKVCLLSAVRCRVRGVIEFVGGAERALILDALRAGNGTGREVAERLGISPRTLRYKLARLREAGVEVPA